MTTIAVVQARMGSTRLPGKVLQDVAGRPLLAFMLARLRPLAVDRLVVATSDRAIDDPVAGLAASAGVAVVRGSEPDVLARFAAVLDAYPADEVVRLTADCPFADPALVGDALARHRAAGADYTSNTLVRTYPDGLDVEVVAAGALRQAAAEATDPAEREHVTPFVYRRPERFRLAALRGPELLGDERWTVDTAEDLDRVRHIATRLAEPEKAGWREILAVAGRTAPPDLWLHPAGPSPAEPAVRTWVAERAGRTVGWSQVAVHAGTGHLRCWSEAREDREALVALTERALSYDRQVRELVYDEMAEGRTTHA